MSQRTTIANYSEEKKLIVWQKNIKINEADRASFIEHIVKNYYASHFKKRDESDLDLWISSLINKYETKEQGSLSFKLPLIAVLEKSEEDTGWEKYELKNGRNCYYKPLPPFSKDAETGIEIDAFFADVDKALKELLEKFPSDNKELDAITKSLDAARDKEKEVFEKMVKNFKDQILEKNDSLRKKQAELDKQEKKLESVTKELNETKHKLYTANEDRSKALERNDTEWKGKYNKLYGLYQDEKQKADEYNQNLTSEKELRITAEKVIEERDKTILQKNELLKDYEANVVFFRSTQGFCQHANSFFDTLDLLLYNVNQLKVNAPSGVNADDYNYYLARIERKYHSIKVDHLGEWRREIQLLSLTGIVLTDGLINSKLGNVSESQQVSTLRTILYQTVMSYIAGAAVTMSDELAYMLPRMVPGVGDTKKFVAITDSLKKSIKDMGYDLNYVKPFTQLSQYKNVENVKFTKADVPQGIIFEVEKMALNFGSTKKKTEVSAK